MVSKDVISQIYHKKDIQEELGLKANQFDKLWDKVATVYKVDMKKFQMFEGSSQHNQYNFNGVSKELIKVLIKCVDEYPIDIDSKNFIKGGESRLNLINSITDEKYMNYIEYLIKAVDEIKYKPLIIKIHTSVIYQETKMWLNLGTQLNTKQQEVLKLMEALPIFQRIELQSKITEAIDETIFQFFADIKLNNKMSGDDINTFFSSVLTNNNVLEDYFINYRLHNKRHLNANNINNEKWIFDNTVHNSLDWLIVELLNKSQRASSLKKETLKTNNALRKRLKKDHLKDIGDLLEYTIKKNDWPLYIAEHLKNEHRRIGKTVINRNKKYKTLIYNNQVNKSYIIKKINTITFYRKELMEDSEIMTSFFKLKSEMINLNYKLMEYASNPLTFAKLDSSLLNYVINDIHQMHQKLNWYLYPGSTKNNPNISIKINSAVDDYGKEYIRFKKETMTRDIQNHTDRNIVVPFLVNQLKSELQKRRFNKSTNVKQNTNKRQIAECDEETEEDVEKLFAKIKEKKRRKKL